MTLRQLRQFGLLWIGLSVVGLLMAVTLGVLDAASWLVYVCIALFLTITGVAFVLLARSHTREDRAYWRSRQPTAANNDVLPESGLPRRQRTLGAYLRSLPFGQRVAAIAYLAAVPLGLAGIPLLAIGVSSHHGWMQILGVALLVVLLAQSAIISPILRVRASAQKRRPEPPSPAA